MSSQAKLILGIVLGIIGAVAIFCLVVCIGSAVNGLTFGEQICEWFNSNSTTVTEQTSAVINAVGQTPIA